MKRCLVSLALTLALALFAQAQVPPEKCLATMKTADGFDVELFASEPLVLNPTSIDVDHKGRVWVAEAVNYRRKNFNRPILRKEGDRIVVLIDSNGDGKADESKVFYQGQDLYGPLSVCVIPQPDNKSLRVLVAQSPDILEFWDRDGDLKADGPPKKFLTGFRGFDHDHGVHGLNIGPDGKLYFTVGDAGVGGLQSSDGKGKKWTSNDSDVQKGTVWRCDLDGTNLELIAHNFRNNYECCVDSFGEIWLSDNDDDGNQQTRICFVFPGGNYGYGPRGPGQTHWHEEQPGIVHKTLRTGFGSPTGITFNEGTLFPEKYRGALLHCDAGPREVRAFFRKPKGAGYELDKEVLLTSSDNWFRPSDVCVGPDGSIFVADWYDPGVGGHGMGDWTRGRIFRLTPKGHTGYKVPEVKLDTKEGVLAALGSPNLATRWLLHQSTLPADSITDKDLADPILNARMNWLATRGLAEKKDKWMAIVAAYLLKSEDVRNQAQGVRLLESLLPQVDLAALTPEGLHTFFGALSSPTSQREAILFLQHVPAASAKPLVMEFAKQYQGNDHFYLAALNIACGTDPTRRDAILADFDKHFPEWNDTVADLVWELRPKSVLPRLEKLLADAKLTALQKARIIDILAASDDPAAGQTMLAVLKSDAAPEVKARAIDSLKLFLPTKWKALQGGKELNAAIDALLKDPKSQQVGLQLVAAVGASDRVEAISEMLVDKNVPNNIKLEALRTLGKLKSVKSVELLDAAIVFSMEIPLKLEAIRAMGSLVTGAPKDAVSAKALQSLQSLVLNLKLPPELPITAVETLAGTRPGTDWLLALKEQGKLPKELENDAGRLLRNSPFQGQRNKAMILFPAPGKLDPKKLPAPAELAKRNGNSERGKQVWNASFAGTAQCAKCHMVRGVGGQVGPDLSMIGKKGSKENIFESILDPSKAIADQYVQHSVTTVNDLVVSGLLVSDTPQGITLRDANGKDTTVPRGDIVGEVRKLKVSIMPQDIVAGLTEDELIDMVAYLETLKTAAFTPDSFRVAGPFPSPNGNAGLKVEFGPEKGAFDANAKFPNNIAWRTVRPDGKGYFDLAAFHGNAGANSVSFLYAEVESPVEQDAEILVGTDDGALLWLNDKQVFASEQTRAAAPEQDKVRVKLMKGKNTVLLKIANGNNPHGAYFTLTTTEELKALPLK